MNLFKTAWCWHESEDSGPRKGRHTKTRQFYHLLKYIVLQISNETNI